MTRPDRCDGAYLRAALDRRQFLCCLGAAVAALQAAPASAAPWASACRPDPAPAARELLARRLEGLDLAALWDVHVHLLGTGDAGSGCFVHPSLLEGFDLVERARMRTILDASCVDPGAASIDRAFVARLDALADASPPGLKLLLFAVEQAHDDAVERIDAARAGGAVALKWLPSAMNIDLRDPRCTRVYDRLAALDLPLVVHCGEERAVPGARREALVNPLLVRVPLERGVRVVVAHCASLGSAQDLDRPAQPQAAAFDLFARLMGERAHEGRLFGDTSAVFQINRRPEVRRALLERHDWHARLLHGSDWPLPGLRPLVSLTRLHAEGLLAEADIEPLDALREHHPVLFDLALKRSLRAGDRGLPAVTFATRGFFERAPKVAAGHMP